MEINRPDAGATDIYPHVIPKQGDGQILEMRMPSPGSAHTGSCNVITSIKFQTCSEAEQNQYI